MENGKLWCKSAFGRFDGIELSPLFCREPRPVVPRYLICFGGRPLQSIIDYTQNGGSLIHRFFVVEEQRIKGYNEPIGSTIRKEAQP